jgi:uncharacterized protein YjbI with pentapeptide repeats
MGVCNDAPENCCGFILEPEDIGDEREADEVWHEITRNACCLREPQYDGLCVWHADTDEKDTEELVEARLTPEDVPCEACYPKEHLNGTILRGIKFPDGFSFGGCVLVGAEFTSTHLFEAEFPNAELQASEFTETNLFEAEFRNADLRDTEFRDTDLRGAKFRDANLRRSQFQDTDLRRSQFPSANLMAAEFSDTNLLVAEFPNANLLTTEFTETDLTGVEFTEACLKGATFSGADLRRVTFQQACARPVESKRDTKTASLGASLEDAQLERGTDLRRADLSGARLYQTAFRDVRINDQTTFGIDSGDAYDTKCRYEYDPNTGVSTSEDVPRLQAAAWTYRRLESLFTDNAMDERARNAHIRKQEAQRQHQREEWRNTEPTMERLNWLGKYAVSTLNWHLTRHGESLGQILKVSVGVILLSALLYPLGGFSSSETDVDYQYPLSTWLQTNGLGEAGSALVQTAGTFLHGLYFSVITFTTIGYGDLYPTGWFAKVLVGVESLAGAILIALFIFVLGRRVAR